MSLLIQFVVVFMLIGIVYMLFYSPYLLAKGLILIVDGYIDGGAKVKSAMPFVNQFIIAKYYEANCGSLLGYFNAIAAIVFSISSTVRILLMFIAPGMVFIAYISMILSVISLLVTWVLSAWMNLNILSEDYEVFGFKKIAYIAIPPLGNYYIGTYLSKFLERAKTREEALQ